MHSLDTLNSKNKKICSDCIGDNYISTRIEETGELFSCSECEEEDVKTITFFELSEYVHAGFKDHCQRTPSEPNSLEYMMLNDKESNYEWWREGEEPEYIVSEHLKVNESISNEIVQILAEQHFDFETATFGEETEYGDETKYAYKSADSSGFYEEWRNFDYIVKSKERYFSQEARRFLENIFGDLDALETREADSVIQEFSQIDAETVFFRGRVFHDEKKLREAMERPDKHLAPPPSNFANAGRMNSKGISVFYGATNPSIALSEIRAPVGSFVLMGQFSLERSIKILDLKRLQQVFARGSIFDPAFGNAEGKSHFLKSLVKSMTRPTNPNKSDEEYLATQIICDFLANSDQLDLDGISYPSSQSNEEGSNIILFHKASKVETLVFAEDTELNSSTYEHYAEGYETDYSVTEWAPKQVEMNEIDDKPVDLLGIIDFDAQPFEFDYDTRETTLKVDPDSLVVHEITGFKIFSSDFNVKRYRYEKLGPSKFSSQN